MDATLLRKKVGMVFQQPNQMCIRDRCCRERLLQEFSRINDHAEAEFRQNSLFSGEENSSWLRLEIHPVSVETADVKTAIVTLRNVCLLYTSP